MPLIHSATTKLQLRLHKEAAASGWGAELKVQAQFVVSSPWMRYQCDIVEGKSKKPDSRFAEQIDYHLHAFAKTNWQWQAKRHADKAFAITTRAMALGHIADLTDPKTSPQWVRIWVLAYTIGYAAGKIMMGPDLELSNFEERSIVYYAPGYELNIKGFQDSYALICDLWGGPVIIETYPGLPQAIWIRPVQINNEEVEISPDFAEMPTLEEISFGYSLLNAKKQITFTFKGKENLQNMLVVGMSRSGKSTFTQNLCFNCMRLRDQVEGMSYIDGAFSPGLGDLRKLGIRLVDEPEQVAGEIKFVQELADERNRIMKERNWTKWRGPVYIVVMDETHKFFARFPEKSSNAGKTVSLWPTTILKLGIMVISITPNFTESEGPKLYWGAHEWKVLFRVEEQVIVQRMFHADSARFKFHPLSLQEGQCVMRRPGSMELEYIMGHPPMLKGSVDE